MSQPPCAIVAASPLILVTRSRPFNLEHLLIQARTFRTIEDARRWLLEPAG